jgi:NitT/TauT family transport system substrate-binding protein
MNIRAVKVVNVKPAQWVDAISNGDVDAIVVSQAYISQIETKLKDKILIWPVQSNQDAFGLVFSKSDWVNQHPDLVRRFLIALAQAEEYAVQNPAGARTIVQNRLELDDAYLDKAWSEHKFSLSLDQALVVAMEDEARWMIANELSKETTIPDFPAYLYVNGLKEVKPEAVNIIR